MILTRSLKALMWALGIGIYLAGRIVLLNFLKTFAFLGIAVSLHFSSALHAETIKPFVIDEAKLITKHSLQTTNKILHEFANNEKGQVYVLVINEDSRESLEALGRRKIDALKILYPEMAGSVKTAYWVIHASRKQSVLVLPPNVPATLPERLNRAKERTTAFHLENGDVNRALMEGSIALTTILLS